MTRHWVTSGFLAFALVLSTALAALAEDSGAAQVEAHDNVVIVLDSSGSMGQPMRGVEKMAAAKTALKTVLGKVPQTTYVGLIVFPYNKVVHQLGPRDDTVLFREIDRVSADGDTPLAQAMKTGADWLLAARQKEFGYGTYKLLVVTDGEETVSERAMNQYAQEIVQRGLVLNTIGVAMAGNHALAKYANSYRSANDSGSLENAIRETFAEVSSADMQKKLGADAYDLIDGFDPAVAQSALDALTKVTALNHPIGEEPKVAAAPNASGATAAPAAPASSGSGGPSAGEAFLVVFGIVIGVITIIAILKWIIGNC